MSRPLHLILILPCLALANGCIVGEIRDELRAINDQMGKINESIIKMNETAASSDRSLIKINESLEPIRESLKKIDDELASLLETIQKLDMLVPGSISSDTPPPQDGSATQSTSQPATVPATQKP